MPGSSAFRSLPLSLLLVTMSACAPAAPQTRPAAPQRSESAHSALNCFPFERLPDALRKRARDLLLTALDSEALYTIASDIKPMSSGFYTAQVTVAKPDLREVEEVRQILDTWTCGGELRASVHHFAAVYEGRRPVEGVVFNLGSFRRLLAGRESFFAGYGLSPSADPVEALMAIEYDQTAARLRGYGYFFGYPEYAVDFFARAADDQKASGTLVPRDFRSLPTARGERRFVYATPRGHEENDADRALKLAVERVFSEYMTRRARHIKDNDSSNVLALVREWFDNGRGVVKPSNAWPGLTTSERQSSSSSNVNATVTTSPSPLSPRTRLGTASSAPPRFESRQTLVSQATPSTTARTGVRPHGRVTGGAWRTGTGAKVQPPFPG